VAETTTGGCSEAENSTSVEQMEVDKHRADDKEDGKQRMAPYKTGLGVKSVEGGV